MKRVHEQTVRGSKAGVRAVPCRCAAEHTQVQSFSPSLLPSSQLTQSLEERDRETGGTSALRHPNLPDWSPHGPVTDVSGTSRSTYLGPRPAGRVPSGGF